MIRQDWSTLKKLMFAKTAAGGAAEVEYTATGNPLTFQTNLARPLKSLLIPFTPKQTGSGDPSPTNIRPIVPWNGVTVNHSGADTSEYTETDISFPSPAYGGTLDAVTGVLTVEWAGIATKWKDGTDASNRGTVTRKKFSLPFQAVTASSKQTGYCNVGRWKWNFDSDDIHFYATGANAYVFLPNDTDGETDVQIIGQLSTPQEIRLTPQQITALVGNNTIWSDADGSMTAIYLKKG